MYAPTCTQNRSVDTIVSEEGRLKLNMIVVLVVVNAAVKTAVPQAVVFWFASNFPTVTTG
jgi:hypothetical protein